MAGAMRVLLRWQGGGGSGLSSGNTLTVPCGGSQSDAQSRLLLSKRTVSLGRIWKLTWPYPLGNVWSRSREYTIVPVGEDRWMAGKPSPDVVLCGSAALRWDGKEAQRGPAGWTSAAGLFSSRGVGFAGRVWTRTTPKEPPPHTADPAAGWACRLYTQTTANVMTTDLSLALPVFSSCIPSKLSFYVDKSGVDFERALSDLNPTKTPMLITV